MPKNWEPISIFILFLLSYSDETALAVTIFGHKPDECTEQKNHTEIGWRMSLSHHHRYSCWFKSQLKWCDHCNVHDVRENKQHVAHAKWTTLFWLYFGNLLTGIWSPQSNDIPILLYPVSYCYKTSSHETLSHIFCKFLHKYLLSTQCSSKQLLLQPHFPHFVAISNVKDFPISLQLWFNVEIH